MKLTLAILFAEYIVNSDYLLVFSFYTAPANYPISEYLTLDA